MKRNIIEINEDLCNGCANCVTGCAEGALQIINGKAKLVRDDFCDGLGACIGHCPTGALKIIQRDAKEFDHKAVEDNLKKTQEIPVEESFVCGCLGAMEKSLKKDAVNTSAKNIQTNFVSGPSQVIPSELDSWPVQLNLINPNSKSFLNKELVLLSSCSPVACPDVHWRYIKNRAVAIACPKLDNTTNYVEKLATIIGKSKVSKVIIVRMEVPCCGGLTHIALQAAKLALEKLNFQTILEEQTVSLTGAIINTKTIN